MLKVKSGSALRVTAWLILWYRGKAFVPERTEVFSLTTNDI